MRRRPLTRAKEPISPYKQILLGLLCGRSNVNSIYRKLRQTGLHGLSYKQKTVDAIKYLEKAGFVADVSGLKRHRSGKEQPKELTVLGRELAELMDNIDQYYRSFSTLTDAIGRNFGVIYMDPQYYVIQDDGIPITKIQQSGEQNTVLRNILRSKGWPGEAIDRSDELYLETLELRELLSPESIFNMVAIRYASIISKFNLDERVDQILKKDIMHEIITNIISEHVSFMFKEMDKLNCLFQTNGLDTQVTIDAFINGFVEHQLNLTTDLMYRQRRLHATFIEKEMIDTLVSVISISKPSQRYVEDKIESIKKDAEGFESESHDEVKGFFNTNLDSEIFKLLTAFKEYKDRKSKVEPIG